MRNFFIFLAILIFTGSQVLQAQERPITGKVTSSEDGNGIPGATILVKGTLIGTTTNIDGNYTLVVPDKAEYLVFSYIGMITQEVAIGSQQVINVTLEPDIFGLDEVVVTGVASGTPRKKLSITVDRVGEERIKEVPALSAAGALQGKIAGVQVVNADGNPGSTPSIRLRGATSLTGSQEPLYIVDGVIMAGNLSDINVDDIESMEVVKGAAGSALYGSRAGNGVISITTKRGANLGLGQTQVVTRNEVGFSMLAGEVPRAEHHPYELASDWAEESQFTKYDGVIYPENYIGGFNGEIIGNRSFSDDHYADNPYAFSNNHQEDLFKNGIFYTNYVSLANNSKKTNFMASFENNRQEGVIFGVEGYRRQNFRANIDHQLSDKLSFSASTFIYQAHTNYSDASSNLSSDPGGGQGTVFFNVLMLNPDINLDIPNGIYDGIGLGQKYMIKPDQWSNEENPKYALEYAERDGYRRGILSNFAGHYYANSWLSFDANYSMEWRTNNFYVQLPKGYLAKELANVDGVLFKENRNGLSQNMQVTANLNHKFGDFTTKGKISYLYENVQIKSMQVTGFGLAAANVTSLDAVTGDKLLSSYDRTEIAKNVFGIADVDYKDKYILSMLYRRDGSSLFGENERWQNYYRFSAAYRITEDVKIPGFQELKLRASYGTAGQRPHIWEMQYETWYLNNGTISPNTIGNKDLKPSFSKETEFALNTEFLNRFSFELIYSYTKTEDQFVKVRLPAPAGFGYQWRNAGTLEAKVWEATLGVNIFDKKDLKWDLAVTFDNVRQKILELNAPPFTHGPGSNNTDVFWFREGETFGIVEGKTWVRDLSVMENQLPDNDDPSTPVDERLISSYVINSDGYVILRGTEGTVNEAPIGFDGDNDGIVDTDVQIADMNPDFNLSFATTFSWKNLSLYALVSWKQGGDIYNMTKQWMYREGLHGDVDQSGKAPNEKKAYDYYQKLYDVNNVNSHFVEDGTYVKLRELSIYYTLGENFWKDRTKGFIKMVKIGVIGRNLWTLTNYTGYDPEVRQGDTSYKGASDDLSVYAFDGYGYPNFRTFTGSIQINF